MSAVEPLTTRLPESALTDSGSGAKTPLQDTQWPVEKYFEVRSYYYDPDLF